MTSAVVFAIVLIAQPKKQKMFHLAHCNLFPILPHLHWFNRKVRVMLWLRAEKVLLERILTEEIIWQNTY